jgi:hypothetical protein
MQALPPDKRPKEPPPPFESMMPSGLTVKWRMPDIAQLVTFDDVIPDPFTGAVITLLKNEKSYQSESDPMRYVHEAQNIKGMIPLTAAMWEWPRFDPNVEYGEGDTLGRREVGYQDHVATFQLMRFTTRDPSLASARTNGAERPADTPSDSDELRADASAADGD